MKSPSDINLTSVETSSTHLGHLGLITAAMAKLNLISKIDARLPVSFNKGAKVSIGKRVAAMILNGLGFVNNRLYLFPEFLQDKPIQKLLQEDDHQLFNDDALGRALDAISEYGVNKLFSEISLEIGVEHKLLGKTAHFDTSTLSLHGEYAHKETESNSNNIKLCKIYLIKNIDETIINTIQEQYAIFVDNENNICCMLNGSIIKDNNKIRILQIENRFNLDILGTKSKPLKLVRQDYFSSNQVLLEVSKKIPELQEVINFIPPLDDSPQPKYGKSKAHRADLKQMVINLATTGKSGFPIWMESHSGNASDQKVLPASIQRMHNFIQGMRNAPSFIYVGDSAMYSNATKCTPSMKWISRVPESIKKAKILLEANDKDYKWEEAENGYKIYAEDITYNGVTQRWLLVYSEQAFNREIKTLNKNIEKEFKVLTKQMKQAMKKCFTTKNEAEQYLKEQIKKCKYHTVNSFITQTEQEKTDNKNKTKVINYNLNLQIELNELQVNKIKNKKGRFILSGNNISSKELSNKDILSTYKAQSKTESGFKFIKSNTFEVDSVYLKKSSRISALMMVMALCLMVYGFSQYQIREQLKNKKDTIPSQTKKQISNPTIAWIYRLFCNIQIIRLEINNIYRETVANVNAILKKIIIYFGPIAIDIYEVNTS